MKCVVCGKNEAIEHGVCSQCLYERANIENIGNVNIAICPKCGSVRIGKKWYREDYADRLLPLIMDEIKCTDPVAKITGDPKSIYFDESSRNLVLKVSIERQNMDSKVETVSVPYSVNYISCPTCNKVTGSYFEATIQLRTVSMKYDDMLSGVLESIEKIMEKRRKMDAASFISKIEKKPEGIDIYLGKKGDGDLISSFILDHYFATLIVSKSLAGVKEGRKFFRFTYSLRILDAPEGAIISVDKRKYILTAVRNRHIDVIDVDTEERGRINRNVFFSNDGKIITKEPQVKNFIVISRTEDESQLMDAQTFRIITIKGRTEGNEIKLFTYKGKYFL
ncbi:60S ribosomal export protein NMD3 [Thermoplasma sp.]|uniref:60S ribosomal export protein NMD3 n=1 Tax=Thermoplasma sp. TaxID=1973142 RepID=UPI00261EDB86|nr:60S ribosomal export protein NMD3 [Thermoplasma sp.]